MGGFRIIIVSLCLLCLGWSARGIENDKDKFDELYNRVQESRQNLEEVARQLKQLAEKTQAVVEEREHSTDAVAKDTEPSTDGDCVVEEKGPSTDAVAKDTEPSTDGDHVVEEKGPSTDAFVEQKEALSDKKDGEASSNKEAMADEKKEPIADAEKKEEPVCARIFKANSRARSGFYGVKGTDNKTVKIYCDMEKKFGRHGNRGWARIGYLNMTVPTHYCPREFKEVTEPVRGCRRASKETSCASMSFPNLGMQPYTTVCGSFVATQHGSPDALIKKGDKDGWEYDGISVHLNQSGTYLVVLGAPGEEINKWFTCPCKALDDPEQETLLTFATDLNPSKFCPSSKEGSCPAKINCCAGEGLPPFCVTLPEPTTDHITVKVCLDDDGEEDITIQQIELLVQ